MSRSRGAGVVLVVLGLVGGCTSTHPGQSAAPAAPATSSLPATSSSSSTSRASPATPAAPASWPTYHRTNDRAGNATDVSQPSALGTGWTAKLDGAVYGQPLVVDGSVIAATENNTVYALNLATGAQLWRTHLGTPVPLSDLPCGNIDPLGITGTPAYDTATKSVFVATETTGGVHDLVAIDPASGAVRFTRNFDVSGHDRLAEQQRSALAVANGRVYVAFGGLYGDCGDYVGYVAAVSTSGTGAITHYDVPTAREGGIWAASGPAIGSDGSVYVAVGNGASTGGNYDGSDAILRLSADLSSRLDYFAPRNWASENASDQDLGSTGPLLVPGGLLVSAGKGGTAYLLDAAKLGGIGGQVATAGDCTAFGGMAVDQASVFIPCTEGLQRFDVSATALTARWRVSVSGSPVVGGGAVWALDTGKGVLHTYDETSGKALASIQVGPVTRFASPVVIPGAAIVGTKAGVVLVRTS